MACYGLLLFVGPNGRGPQWEVAVGSTMRISSREHV